MINVDFVFGEVPLLGTSFRLVEEDTPGEITDALVQVGDFVQNEAIYRFVKFGGGKRSALITASGFRSGAVEFRTGGVTTIGQTLPRSRRRRPNYIELQIRKALIPARDKMIGQAETYVVGGAGEAMRKNGIPTTRGR